MNERIYDAFVQIFEEVPDATELKKPRVEVFLEEGWRTLPLEWNVAKRVADLSGYIVRIVDAEGSPLRDYVPVSIRTEDITS